jgi:hypothetical protein
VAVSWRASSAILKGGRCLLAGYGVGALVLLTAAEIALWWPIVALVVVGVSIVVVPLGARRGDRYPGRDGTRRYGFSAVPAMPKACAGSRPRLRPRAASAVRRAAYGRTRRSPHEVRQYPSMNNTLSTPRTVQADDEPAVVGIGP